MACLGAVIHVRACRRRGLAWEARRTAEGRRRRTTLGEGEDARGLRLVELLLAMLACGVHSMLHAVAIGLGSFAEAERGGDAPDRREINELKRGAIVLVGLRKKTATGGAIEGGAGRLFGVCIGAGSRGPGSDRRWLTWRRGRSACRCLGRWRNGTKGHALLHKLIAHLVRARPRRSLGSCCVG